MTYSDADNEDALKIIEHLADLYSGDDPVVVELLNRIYQLAKGADLTSEEYEMLHPTGDDEADG